MVPHISGRALVAPWVTLGPGAIVHPFALVGHLPSRSKALARAVQVDQRLLIGAATEIGPHATIYGGSQIGDDCLIGDGASIREGCRVGSRCIVGRMVQLQYDVTIEDDVKIECGCHITGGMTIGAGSFLGPGVVTSNDRRVDMAKYQFHGIEPPRIGKRVLVGTGANILAGVTIGDDAVIAAGAVVVEDVPAGGRVIGHKGVMR